MKKLFLLILLLTVLGANAQYTEIKLSRDNTLLSNFNLSTIRGSDTSFIFKVSKTVSNSWSIHNLWTGVTGSGSISLEVTSFDNLTGFIPYADSLSTTIVGTTGTGAWEDSIWAWTYFKLKITKGSISAGYLKSKFTIN